MKQNSDEEMRDLILDRYKSGEIVISTADGLQVAKLSEIIKQPTEGILYDINRDFGTILTLIHDRKWVNDFALSKVVEALKNELADESEKGMIFAEWCQNGPVMWHGFFCGWFYKYESMHIKENVKTTSELYASESFLKYYNERKSK